MSSLNGPLVEQLLAVAHVRVRPGVSLVRAVCLGGDVNSLNLNGQPGPS